MILSYNDWKQSFRHYPSVNMFMKKITRKMEIIVKKKVMVQKKKKFHLK